MANECFTCGSNFEYTPFGDATMIKCARCVQASRLEDATRAQVRAAEEASRRQADAAREAAWHQQQAASALAAALATAAAQAQASERRARAAEASLEEDRARRAASAEDAEERATKCPWCGKIEAHAAFVDCVDADDALEELGDILTGDDDWDDDVWSNVADELERLSSALGDAATVQAGTYPYCSKKCRHDARSAGDDDATAVPRLEARRSALHARVSDAWKRGGAMRARAAGIAQQKARAAREALSVLTAALKDEEDHKTRVAAARAELARAKERQDQAASALVAAKSDLSEATTALELAQASTKSFFGRLGGAEARAATAQVEVDGARSRIEAQVVVLARSRDSVNCAEKELKSMLARLGKNDNGSNGLAHIIDLLGLAANAHADSERLIRPLMSAPDHIIEIIISGLVKTRSNSLTISDYSDQYFVSMESSGIEVAVSKSTSAITACHLYSGINGRYAAYRGSLPHPLSSSMTRGAVENLMGPPRKCYDSEMSLGFWADYGHLSITYAGSSTTDKGLGVHHFTFPGRPTAER